MADYENRLYSIVDFHLGIKFIARVFRRIVRVLLD